MSYDDLGLTYDQNLERVKNLLNSYEIIAKGRKSPKQSDLLRVSVVLLHATLEDFLRSLLKFKLPSLGEDKLKKIPLYSMPKFSVNPKFDLGELSKYRGKSVDFVIEESVNQYLDRASFNNPAEISASLERVELNVTLKIKSFYPALKEMIKRRHNIVHQADREVSEGKGYHRVKSISKKQVQNWIKSVDGFITELAKQL